MPHVAGASRDTFGGEVGLQEEVEPVGVGDDALDEARLHVAVLVCVFSFDGEEADTVSLA